MNVYEKLADPVALAVFIATLLLPVAVGFAALRRTRSQSDFFVGGRAMGRIVVALSAVSSGRSSWLVLGVSGMAYTLGAGAIWAILGYTVVELFQFVWVGRRLREESGASGSITLLDWLQSRFDERRHAVRLVGAAIIAVFITAYVSAQLYAGAKTLGSALGIDFGWCLVLSGALILVYMMLGGYVAVAWNDVVRAVLMLAALVLLPIAGLAAIGGPGVLRAELIRLDPAAVDPVAIGLGAILGFLAIGLGSPGQPHILVRYMSIADPARLRSAAVIGTVWNVVLGFGAVTIGLIGRVAVPQAADLPDGDPEMVYLVLASQHVAAPLYGILVGGVFAAILSTADSQLLVVASTFVRDVWEKALRRGAELDEAARLRASRIVLLLAGALALGLASVASDLVFWLVLFAWGGLGASLGPAVILSLGWRRTTAAGVIAGMLTGAIVTIAWKLWLKEPTGVYELIPAFALATAAIVVVSAASPYSKTFSTSR